MTMRASLIITAKDQASGVFDRIAAGAKRMGSAFRPVQKEAAGADRAMGRIGTGAFARFARIGAAARKMARDMRIAERAGYALGTAIGFSIRTAGAFVAGTAKWALAAASAGATFGIGALITGAIRVGAQFEQFEVMLRTVTGSAAAARRSMAWVQKFAETTPYELTDVMEAFVKLKTRGLDPTDGTLRSLGDAAAAMGKNLDQAVEMMAHAMTGEFERLKEFGVTASQKGDQVTFHWMKNGKAMSSSTRKDGAEIRKALSQIFDGNYKGAMDAQSKTFSGMISNLKDKWTGFQKAVADAGIFDLVKQKLAALLDWLNEAAKDGRLKKWAKDISDWLEKAFKWAVSFVTETDWKKVGAELKAIAGAAWTVAKALEKVVGWAQKAQSFLSAISWATNPLGSAIDLIGGFSATPGSPAPKPAPAPRTPTLLKPGVKPVTPWTPAAPRTNMLLKPGVKAVPAWPVRSKQAGNDVNVGGKVQIEVRTAPGTRVRTTSLASSNPRVPVTVRTGRAMAGAA